MMSRARKKDPPETKTPAAKGSATGGNAELSRAAQSGSYSYTVRNAIARYTVDENLVVIAFAAADRLLGRIS